MRTPDYPSDDQVKWAAVDDYFSQLLAPPDNHLSAALQANSQAGLPAHDVSAMQGKMLALLISIQNASRVLEIGTLGGYSTIWMAQALGEGGTITTIEADPRHAQVARENVHQAGLSERVRLHVGAALDVLPHLQAPFDLIFIDADKKNNPGYLRWAIQLSRPGSLIIVDNIVRGGAVIDAGSTDGNVQGVRECLRLLASDPRLEATAIQTVGEKGWDGFALARVKSREESAQVVCRHAGRQRTVSGSDAAQGAHDASGVVHVPTGVAVHARASDVPVPLPDDVARHHAATSVFPYKRSDR